MLAVARRTLADLPPPSTDIFTLRPPWCPIPARAVTDTLRVDPGLMGVWRMRGVGPRALPADWTKGRSLAYQVSGILDWLAARRGETFDQRACWLDYLRINLGDGCATLDWVQRLARSEGPRMGDVEFTQKGWKSYLALLSS